MKMSLGLNTQTKNRGDFLSIIKFNANLGGFFVENRSPNGDGTWSRDYDELKLPIKLVMDLGDIDVGWLSLANGAPDFEMVKVGDKMPAQPSSDHKDAFRVKVFNKSLGLRAFSHNAKTVVNCMENLHNQFEAERGANMGKMPVVEISEILTLKYKKKDQTEGRVRLPAWKIVSWIDAPDVFTAKKEVAAEAPAAEEDDLF
jgi:hypothetical protein